MSGLIGTKRKEEMHVERTLVPIISAFPAADPSSYLRTLWCFLWFFQSNYSAFYFQGYLALVSPFCWFELMLFVIKIRVHWRTLKREVDSNSSAVFFLAVFARRQQKNDLPSPSHPFPITSFSALNAVQIAKLQKNKQPFMLAHVDEQWRFTSCVFGGTERTCEERHKLISAHIKRLLQTPALEVQQDKPQHLSGLFWDKWNYMTTILQRSWFYIGFKSAKSNFLPFL